MNQPANAQSPWRGAHHLSLVTRDLDATVRFYHGLLGMPLFGAMGPRENHGCHYLFKAGHFIMHFFAQPDAEIPTPPAGWEKHGCLLYTSPSPRDRTRSRMPSSA